MKPLPSHPPLSTRRSRGRGEGGVGRSSSKELGGGGDSSVDTSTARWAGPDADRGPNPTWMKKLEERYQKLHHKIASIPSYNSTASRFNFLTRKILNERLARAHKNGHHHADAAAAAVAGEGEGGRNTNTAPDIAATTTARLTGKCVNRNPSTAPNDVSYDILQTEEFVSLADSSNNNNNDDDDDDSDDLNDENFPPATRRTAERAAVTVLNGEGAAGLARPSPRCLCSSHSHCRTDPAVSEYPSLPPCPLHGGGGRGGGGGGGGGGGRDSGAGRGRSGESAETRDDQVLQARRGSPLSKRDEALEANNNSAADLAEPAGLAHVSHGRPTSLPLHGTGDHPQPGISSRAGRLTSASQALGHGHEDSTGTGAGRDNNAGDSDVEGRGGGGGGRGGGGGGGGVANSGWVGWDMGEASARGVRTLNPITNRAAGKQGGYMLRTAQTGVSHHSHATTTKSCPAVLNSNDLPTLARRAGGGRQEAGGGGHDMRVFAQMSVEARHAVTETLREMEGAGERRDSEDWLEGDGEGEEEDDDDEDYAEEEEEEVNNGDDDDDYNNGNSNVSLPSLTDPHSTFSTQHHHHQQHHQQRRSKQHNDTTTSTQQQQQQSREDSMVTGSNRTCTTRQRSLRDSRQGADATSSVNATVKGARSPRRTGRKPRSTHANVVNKRGRPRSGKGRGTTHVDVPSNDNERGGDMDLDLISMASTGNASSNRSSPVDRHEAKLRTHLPAITSRTDPNVTPPARKDSIRHVNYRIRGVGSYRVARETTFEITAPDFDIRYRDVITCQKGDRDTPPPDIFEKSVGKVRDWLNKYYFHNS